MKLLDNAQNQPTILEQKIGLKKIMTQVDRMTNIVKLNLEVQC